MEVIMTTTIKRSIFIALGCVLMQGSLLQAMQNPKSLLNISADNIAKMILNENNDFKKACESMYKKEYSVEAIKTLLPEKLINNITQSILNQKNKDNETLQELILKTVPVNIKAKSLLYSPSEGMINPDGNLITLRRNNSTRLKIVNPQTCNCLYTIQHDFFINYVEFSPNNQLIAILDKNHSIYIWNLALKKKLDIKLQHNNRVESIRFSPDNTKIAIHSAKSVYIWKVKSGELLCKIQHEDKQNLTSIEFTPDSKKIAIHYPATGVRIFDAKNGNCLEKLNYCKKEIIDSKFSPNIKLIIGTSNDALHIYDTKTGNYLRKLSNYNNSNSARFTPNGEKIITIPYTEINSIHIHDLTFFNQALEQLKSLSLTQAISLYRLFIDKDQLGQDEIDVIEKIKKPLLSAIKNNEIYKSAVKKIKNDNSQIQKDTNNKPQKYLNIPELSGKNVIIS